MADATTIPPPPDIEQAVPSVPRTTKEKVLEGIGSRATAFGQGLSGLSGSSMHPFEESSVGRALGQHYNDRLAQARRHYENAQTYGSILGGGEIDPKTGEPTGIDPQTGKPLTPEQRQQYKQMAEGAWADYQKIAGTSKEVKQQLQQKKGLFDILVSKGHKALAGMIGAHQKATGGGQGGAQGGGQTLPPPPSTTAPAEAVAAAAPGVGGKVIPPPPAYNEQTAAQAPALREKMADNRAIELERVKQDIITKGKIAEEQAKPPTGKQPTPAADAYFSLLDQIDPETGEKYTPQKALQIVSKASQKAGKPTPFEEYMSDKENYAKFLKEVDDAKAAAKGKSPSASIGAVYGIYRMMEMGYKQNPDILPIVAQLAPEVFKKAGIDVPPAMAAALGKIPVDQPLSPTTGQPIGTSMPSAPTGATRTAAQSAARVGPIITDLRQQIGDLKKYLGPEEGRANVKYLLGKAGSTGDLAKDRALSGLRTNLELLITLTAKFHINSVRAMQEIGKLADAGKDSAPALLGFIDQVEKRSKETEQQEKGFGEIPPPPSPGAGRVIKYDAQGNRM